jgi:hypothetical protein
VDPLDGSLLGLGRHAAVDESDGLIPHLRHEEMMGGIRDALGDPVVAIEFLHPCIDGFRRDCIAVGSPQ